MRRQFAHPFSQVFQAGKILLAFLVLIHPSLHSSEKFSANYVQTPLSEILYDLSKHYKYNSLILDLEHRTGSYRFNDCTMEECLYQLHLGQQLWFLTASDFAAFTRNENYIGNWVKKKKKLELQMSKRSYPKISISYKNAQLHTVLTYLIEEMNLPLQVSNRVTGNVSLNLVEANGYETFFYLLTFYKLTVVEDYGKRVVIPELDLDK